MSPLTPNSQLIVERARQCFAADGDRGERTIVETRAKRIVQRKIVVLVACPVGDFLRHTVGQVLAYRFGCAVFPGTADVDFFVWRFHVGYLVDHLPEGQGRAAGRT